MSVESVEKEKWEFFFVGGEDFGTSQETREGCILELELLSASLKNRREVR